MSDCGGNAKLVRAGDNTVTEDYPDTGLCLLRLKGFIHIARRCYAIYKNVVQRYMYVIDSIMKRS